jgi:Superfamily I DNA and RNA helicases and helicase subunits
MTNDEWRVERCTVSRWDDGYVYGETAEGSVCLGGDAVSAMRPLLRVGMQLNIVGDLSEPQLVVVEPDFLMDVTAVAGCFAQPGMHPLSYTLKRMEPRANSQAILLGNFAGAALDDIIAKGKDYDVSNTLWRSFREQAMQFCACEDFDSQRFIDDARQQAANLEEVVAELFAHYDRRHALLEPSFVCEALGLQGRVDLMTDDLQLLVEQKSGRNHRIEKQAAIVHRTDHFVQLLLYYGILRMNFQQHHEAIDIRLLYSKYPAREGLLRVDYQPRLLARAIQMRNLLVAWELHFAREGTEALLPLLPPMGETERDYFLRMTRFIYREQLCSRMQARPGQYAISDLWRMPTDEKLRTGNIYTGLQLLEKQQSDQDGGFDLLTLGIPEDTTDYVRNFRRGDSVYLYHYDGSPDVRRHILYKGTLQEIQEKRLVVRLNDGQHNSDLLTDGTYAVEHGSSDNATAGDLRSIYELVTADDLQRRQLLLGQRAPEADMSEKLSRSYHPDYDDILLKAKQARDFFLLVGPPGTGKTSMALRFLVEEELSTMRTLELKDGAIEASKDDCPGILLTAYTNRAVDEICDMLTAANIDYLRLGNEASCDPRFVGHLLEHRLGERPRLTEMKQLIREMPVVVATTSMLQSRPFIFSLKRFSLCIVDEASQLLDPGIVGVLTKDIDRFILIGDHKQLPAVVQQQDSGDCSRSLFERLLRQERQAGRTQFVGVLHKQGRMHPDVAAFTNELFYQDEQITPVPLTHQKATTLDYDQPSEDGLDDLLRKERVVFFDSGRLEKSGQSVIDGKASEAAFVADLLRRIYRFYGERFDPQKTIGIIVPYRIEIGRIRHEIAKLKIPELLDISIDTVERYQGSQRDVIIYDFAINDNSQLQFITATCFEDGGHVIDRKLNVAMTRARKQLLMVGNAAILRQNEIFAALIARYARFFS